MADIAIPAWPRSTPATLARVREVLDSGHWSLPPDSADARVSAEGRFASRFADFIGTAHCVPTVNGSSALVVALEALGVGAGDEVVIPALTWVANVTTVLAVNAVPVMADIDPQTLCASPAAIEAAITERTKAIVVVHLYSSVADLDAILTIATRHGIPVLEDCSHAHGASWKGRRVGGWGSVGAFSMQSKKLLTAGEGGAAVCSDENLYDRLYQLHSDGRRPAPDPAEGGTRVLEGAFLSGTNYRISELGAAVLDAQLEDLPEQNRRRAANGAVVDGLLAKATGVTPVAALPSVTERTFYYYAARIDRDAFGGVTAETVCRALAAETGIPFAPTYPPLYRHPLYQPHSKRRFQIRDLDPARLDGPVGGLPEAERAHLEVLTFHHPVLLGPGEAFDALPEAIEKLQRHTDELRALEKGR